MKVLLGVGGSSDAFQALEEVIERTKEAQDELTVAILENPETEPNSDDIERKVRAELAESNVSASVRRVTGDPGSRLVEIAETEEFDAIALGGGQRSPLGKITLGHISEFVILNATVSVILVR